MQLHVANEIDMAMDIEDSKFELMAVEFEVNIEAAVVVDRFEAMVVSTVEAVELVEDMVVVAVHNHNHHRHRHRIGNRLLAMKTS